MVLVLQLEKDVGEGHVRPSLYTSILCKDDSSAFLLGISGRLLAIYMGFHGFFNCRKAIDGRYLDLNEVVKAVVLSDELLRVISSLLVRDLEDAHRHYVQIVYHHVELTRLIFSLLVLSAERLKGQMVQLKGHIATNRVQASLIMHFCRLPEALRAIDRVALCQVNIGVERL